MTDLVFFPASSRPEERQGVAVRVSDLRSYLAAERARDPEVGFVLAHSCVGTLPHTGDGAPVRILSESAAATLAPVPYAVRLGFAEDALRVAGPAWFGERYVSRAAVDRALAALEPAAEAARALEKGTLSTMDSGVWLLVPGPGADGQPRYVAERAVVRHPVGEGPERAARRLAAERGDHAAVIAEFGRTPDGKSAAMAEGLGHVLSAVAPPDRDLQGLLAEALMALRDTFMGYRAKDLALERLPEMLAAIDDGSWDLREGLTCAEFEARAPDFFAARCAAPVSALAVGRSRHDGVEP